jgi:DNA-binding response OmpR family regulator
MILTARTEVADGVRGLDSGADRYLAEPFHHRQGA